MSKIKILAGIFLFLTSFTFTSCDNEPIDPNIDLDDFNNGQNNGAAVLKADFSGSTWTATAVQAVFSGNLLTLSGIKANGEGFGFIVAANTTGTYPANTNLLTFTPVDSEFGYWSTNINNPNEDTGSITITSINTANKTISGSFNFKGYWSDTDNTSIIPVQFTNGVFQNVPYITQEETGDTFAAKVNNTDFLDVNILTITTDINGQEFISVGAQDTDLNSITVSVKSDLAVGNYNITGNTTTDVVQAIYDFDDENYVATSGNVNITTKTATRIKGTFSFVSGTFNVTQGSFDVEY